MLNIVDGGGAAAVAQQVSDGGGASSMAQQVMDGGPASYEYSVLAQGALTTRRQGFQGDPRLIMGENGTRLQFVGGQPLMDTGLENLVLISLFTNEGWCGNQFMKSGIGSGFVEACNQPITRQSLNEIKAAAERALVNPALGRVTVTVTNPTGQQLKVHIFIEPPAKNPQELVLNRHGGNWQSQAENPAYPQVRQERWRKKLVETDNVLQFEGGADMEF